MTQALLVLSVLEYFFLAHTWPPEEVCEMDVGRGQVQDQARERQEDAVHGSRLFSWNSLYFWSSETWECSQLILICVMFV